MPDGTDNGDAYLGPAATMSGDHRGSARGWEPALRPRGQRDHRCGEIAALGAELIGAPFAFARTLVGHLLENPGGDEIAQSVGHGGAGQPGPRHEVVETPGAVEGFPHQSSGTVRRQVGQGLGHRVGREIPLLPVVHAFTPLSLVETTQLLPFGMAKAAHRLDLIVLGATGFTGKLATARLALLQERARRAGDPFPTWGIAGRDRGRLAAVLRDVPDPVDDLPIIDDVDVHDPASLRRLAEGARVLLNLVGPYSSSAEGVIDACVAAGTHYADLSGELPLLRRVIDRFDDAARQAGCQVVQLAGWEALAPDIAALHACRLAAGVGDGEWGPGASAPVRRLDITVDFHEKPDLKADHGSVSAGTLGSIVEIFSDPGARILGDPAGLLPAPHGQAARAVRRMSPLRVRPAVRQGRLIGPLVPVAFLNPPALHRTAALLADEQGTHYQPARIREGVDQGEVAGLTTVVRVAGQAAQSLGQRGAAIATRLPLAVRRILAGRLRRILPAAGTGPAAEALDGWRWSVRAAALGQGGRRGQATLNGSGHPGYTATAAMLVALGLRLAETHRRHLVAGVITPAVAFGPDPCPSLQTPELSLQIDS